MKPYNTPFMGSYQAGEDLSSAQYMFVKVDPSNANKVLLCDTAGEVSLGILMNKPESGEYAEVALPGGGAKLIVDGSVSPGAMISTGADGKGETATSSQYIGAMADATGAASSANDAIPVIVCSAYAASDVSEAESVSFAAAAGAANVCDVAITVKDGAGAAVGAVRNLLVWLSDAATGAGLTGTSASGTVQAKAASGADHGVLTAKKSLIAQTLATGIYTLEITDTAKTAFYVCAMDMSTGKTFISDVLETADYGA